MSAYSAAAFVAMMILNYFYNDTVINDVKNPELTRVLTEPKISSESSTVARPNVNNGDIQVLELDRQERGSFGGLGQMFKSEWRYYLINSSYLMEQLSKQKKSISQSEVVLLRVTHIGSSSDLYLDVYMRRKAKPTERLYDFKESTARYPTIHIKLPSLRHQIEWFVGLTPATGVGVFNSLEYTIDIVVVQSSNTYNPTTAFAVFAVVGLIAFSFVAACFFALTKLKNKLWKTTSAQSDDIPKTTKPFVWLRTDNELIPLSDKDKLNQVLQHSFDHSELLTPTKSDEKSKGNKLSASLDNTSRSNDKSTKKTNIVLGKKGSSEALRMSPREKLVEENGKDSNPKRQRGSGSVVKEQIAKFERMSLQNK
jgi:hypothetical protein